LTGDAAAPQRQWTSRHWRPNFVQIKIDRTKCTIKTSSFLF